MPHLSGWNCYSDYTGTGDPYQEGDGAPEVTQEDQGPCVTGESGREVCLDPQKKNCGTFNGEPYCVSPQDVPGCKHSSGNVSVICHMNPDGSPPTGAPATDFGSPEAPEQSWDHTDTGQNLHHMGGWTGEGTSGQSGDSSGTGNEPGTISNGSAIEGDNNGDGECQSTEDCAGGGPELGEHPGLPVEDMPTLNWSSGLAGTGSCPAAQNVNLSFVEASISFSYGPLCDFAATIRPYVLAAAYFMAGLLIVTRI